MKRQLIFDFDGTLLDVSRQDYAIYVDVINDLSLGSEQHLQFEQYWSLRRDVTMICDILQMTNSYIRPTHFINGRASAFAEERYSDLTTLFPHVKETLTTLKDNFDLYVLSMRENMKGLIDKIDQVGLTNVFSDVFIAPHGKQGKLSKFENPVAMVGDTEYDIFPALALRITAIGVSTGIRSREILKTYSPNFIIDDIEELSAIVGTL